MISCRSQYWTQFCSPTSRPTSCFPQHGKIPTLKKCRPTWSYPYVMFHLIPLFSYQGSPRKENEVAHQGTTSSGAFQVYRRPTGPIAVTTVNASATPEKKPPPSSTTSTTSKSLTSVIEDHQRRGEVLRKQQQLLTKQLFEIQVSIDRFYINAVKAKNFAYFPINSGGKKSPRTPSAETALN